YVMSLIQKWQVKQMVNKVHETNQEIVLNARNLNISASGKPIVKGINFHIKKREIFCLIGESGSGKSVTAAAIMGLLPGRSLNIAEGSITLGDVELANCPEKKLRKIRGNRITMVFQEPMTALNPLMRVGKQVAEV